MQKERGEDSEGLNMMNYLHYAHVPPPSEKKEYLKANVT